MHNGFHIKVNNVHRAEYRTMESTSSGMRSVLEIAPIIEEEAAEAIEAYKALLP